MVLSYTTSKLDQILPKLENAFCFNLTTKPVYIICICSSTTITELQITSYAPYNDSNLLRPGPDVPALLGVGAAVREGEGGGEVQHALVLGVLQQARAAAACHG